MTAEIPDDIVRYVAARDRDRAEQVDQALAALTDRERALVRAAAVMGYVHGTLAERGEPIPPDTDILREVVAACQSMPNLYPTIARHQPAEEQP